MKFLVMGIYPICSVSIMPSKSSSLRERFVSRQTQSNFYLWRPLQSAFWPQSNFRLRLNNIWEVTLKLSKMDRNSLCHIGVFGDRQYKSLAWSKPCLTVQSLQEGFVPCKVNFKNLKFDSQGCTLGHGLYQTKQGFFYWQKVHCAYDTNWFIL